MKEWAKAFYLGKSWEQCRDAYMESQNNICERCGEPAKICHHRIWLTRDNINNPYITLAWDNLEALCQDCHNKEHHKKEPKLRYSFDEEGNIIYNTPYSPKKIKGTNTEGDTAILPCKYARTWCRGVGCTGKEGI